MDHVRMLVVDDKDELENYRKWGNLPSPIVTPKVVKTVDAALEIVRSRGAEFDIILCDYDLSDEAGRNGINVLREAHDAGYGSAVALYSSQPLPARVFNITKRYNCEVWPAGEIIESFQAWYRAWRRLCLLSTNGRCLGRKDEDYLARIQGSRYCYLSLPYKRTGIDPREVKSTLTNWLKRYVSEVVMTLTAGAPNAFSHIENSIKHATLMVADISGRRSSVFMEIGMALAYETPTILIGPEAEMSDIPFNAQPLNIECYQGTSIEEDEGFQARLLAKVKAILKVPREAPTAPDHSSD